MKKLVLALEIVMLVLLVVNCMPKEDLYEEETKVLNELISSTNLFIHDLDRTNNRIAIGRAVVQYTNEIKRSKSDLWNLEKICPNYLRIDGYKQAPKELQPLFKKFYDALEQIRIISDGKMAKFSQDKNLLKIFDELKEALYYY